jgi:hypothetical protein
MKFEVSRNGKADHVIDATATLSDFGRDAKTLLPEYK